MTYSEQVELKHDWLVAQFQLVCGSFLAILAGIFVAALTLQVPLAEALAVGAWDLANTIVAWWLFAAKTKELRESLIARSTSERME